MFASYYCTATSTITLPLNVFKRLPSISTNHHFTFHQNAQKIHSASGSRSPFCLAMGRNRNGPGTDRNGWISRKDSKLSRYKTAVVMKHATGNGSKTRVKNVEITFKWLSNRICARNWCKVNVFFSNLQALRSSIQPEHIGHPMHLSSSKLYKQVTWTSSTLDILSLLQSWSSGKSFTCQGDDHLGFWTCFPKKDCWFRVLSSF